LTGRRTPRAVASPALIAERGLSHAGLGLVIGAFMVPETLLTVPVRLAAGRHSLLTSPG
jgi:hypothetical protein